MLGMLSRSVVWRWRASSCIAWRGRPEISAGKRATLTLTVVDSRPTWQLVLEVAKRRRERKETTFRMADLVADIQRIDPRRARSSIQPVIQEMTLNAGLGPTQPCGKVLIRVQHGWYQLLSDDE